MQERRKLFNMSLHRSGTQSFNRFCEDLGFSCQHWPGFAFSNACAPALGTLDLEYVWDLYSRLTGNADVFSDIPMPFLAEYAARDFGDGRFLMIERPVHAWVASVRRHLDGREMDVLEKMQYWTICNNRSDTISGYSDEELIAGYRTHRDMVGDTLSRHGIDLFLFNLDSPDIAPQIASFCGKKIESHHIFRLVDRNAPGTTDPADRLDPGSGEPGTNPPDTADYVYPPAGWAHDFIKEDDSSRFWRVFGNAPDDDWYDVLERSLLNPVASGIHFPTVPDSGFQVMINGSSDRASLQESFGYYKFAKQHSYRSHRRSVGTRIVEFGCGWGRNLRPFMKDFELTDMYGFEPDFRQCAVARATNPYLNFIGGRYSSTGLFPPGRFDLAMAWSAFLHLSEETAVGWLGDIAGTLRSSGTLVVAVWGLRFLRRLEHEAERRRLGEEIDWYSAVCINAAGPLADRIAEYEAGRFVWFTGGGSQVYGEAFISLGVMQRWIMNHGLPLEIVFHDLATFEQDVFVMRKL